MPGCITLYVAASGALLAAVVSSSFVKHPSDSLMAHFTRSNLSILVCVNAACSVLVGLFSLCSSPTQPSHNAAQVGRPVASRAATSATPSSSTPTGDPTDRHAILEARKKKMLEESREKYLAKKAAMNVASK